MSNLCTEKSCKIGTIVLDTKFNILSSFKKDKNLIEVDNSVGIDGFVRTIMKTVYVVYVKDYFFKTPEQIGTFLLDREIKSFKELSGLKENADKFSQVQLTKEICDKLVGDFLKPTEESVERKLNRRGKSLYK